jgi:hypothetical protein
MVLFVTIAAMVISASAANYAGSPRVVTSGWDGRTYSGMSILRIIPDHEQGGSDVGAGIEVIAEDGDVIENSFIRAEPRLYLDGELWLAEGWHYSDGSENGLYAEYFTYFVSRGGQVFAKSVFGIYNGTGYTTYTAPQTATINVNSVTNRAAGNGETVHEEFGINDNGQTYGSGWSEETPELIKAIGADGVHGYVYDDDLLALADKNSPYTVTPEIPESIPLYAVDGTTVVGEFLIGCPNG